MLEMLLLIVTLVFTAPHAFATDDWSGQCYTTAQLRQENPQVVSTPILFWRAKVQKEISLVMVQMPESQQILINLMECQEAERRGPRPCENAAYVENVTEAPEDGAPRNCRPLGDLWVPLVDIAEPSTNARSTNFNLDHPTEYFASRVSHHLQGYASDMQWDPLTSAALSSMDQLFLAAVGGSIWYLSTHHFVPKTFWSRMRRRGMQGIGILLLIRQGYLAATGARSEFVTERNQRADQIEALIRQINERLMLRLDGQDECGNLEENDGYSALVNSITRANADTFQQFCNQE